MTSVQERTKTIDVPPNTGIEGFLHVIREVLRLPRVQKIVVEGAGRVTLTQLCKEDAEPNVNVTFEHLEPHYIIRNTRLQEVSYPPSMSALCVIATMLDIVHANGLTPIAFVAAPSTSLWTWLHFGDDLTLAGRDVLLGQPLYTDRYIPDTALVLCAGVDHTTSLLDTKLSLKIEMKRDQPILGEEVDVS